jgi:hypothetical protein
VEPHYGAGAPDFNGRIIAGGLGVTSMGAPLWGRGPSFNGRIIAGAWALRRWGPHHGAGALFQWPNNCRGLGRYVGGGPTLGPGPYFNARINGGGLRHYVGGGPTLGPGPLIPMPEQMPRAWAVAPCTCRATRPIELVLVVGGLIVIPAPWWVCFMLGVA